jgi:hypothetical protein
MGGETFEIKFRHRKVDERVLLNRDDVCKILLGIANLDPRTDFRNALTQVVKEFLEADGVNTSPGT